MKREEERSSTLIRWAIWTLLFSLALGGDPWIFPSKGKHWLDEAYSRQRSE